jgi:uncharacterized coiled-coil DUF342 family protein
MTLEEAQNKLNNALAQLGDAQMQLEYWTEKKTSAREAVLKAANERDAAAKNAQEAREAIAAQEAGSQPAREV